jgi:hypothetical protein
MSLRIILISTFSVIVQLGLTILAWGDWLASSRIRLALGWLSARFCC